MSRSTIQSRWPDTVASTRRRHSKAVLWVTPHSSAAFRQRLSPTAFLGGKISSPVRPATSALKGFTLPIWICPIRPNAHPEGLSPIKDPVGARANSLFGWEEHDIRGPSGPRIITCSLNCYLINPPIGIELHHHEYGCLRRCFNARIVRDALTCCL